jgi:hypothetical protein
MVKTEKTSAGLAEEKGTSQNVDCSLPVEGARWSEQGSVSSKNDTADEMMTIHHLLETSVEASIEALLVASVEACNYCRKQKKEGEHKSWIDRSIGDEKHVARMCSGHN